MENTIERTRNSPQGGKEISQGMIDVKYMRKCLCIYVSIYLHVQVCINAGVCTYADVHLCRCVHLCRQCREVANTKELWASDEYGGALSKIVHLMLSVSSQQSQTLQRKHGREVEFFLCLDLNECLCWEYLFLKSLAVIPVQK